MARMFEDAKIERLLMGLDAPGYGMVRSYIDPADQIGLDRLAYQRIILGVLTVASTGVVAVGPAGHFPAVSGEPTHVDGLSARRLPGPGLDPPLCEELGV